MPGVPLIGPKLASELLQKYGSLEQVLDHAQEISGQKRRENLIRYRQQALLSRSLVKLDDRVPLDVNWLAARTRHVDRNALESLCQEFGFRRLAERVLGDSGPEPAAAPARQRWEVNYHTVTTLDELRQPGSTDAAAAARGL